MFCVWSWRRSQQLVGEVAGVDPCCRDREVLVAAVGSVARLQAWLDGRNAAFAAGLAKVTVRPEQVVAQAARTSTRDADRVLDRARTVEAIPALGEALDAGRCRAAMSTLSAGSCAQLEPGHRDAVACSAGWLVELASTSRRPSCTRR